MREGDIEECWELGIGRLTEEAQQTQSRRDGVPKESSGKKTPSFSLPSRAWPFSAHQLRKAGGNEMMSANFLTNISC